VALIKKTHEASLHHGWKKTLTTLRNTFAWKGMSSQVKRVVESCVECAQTRGRRNLAHEFSSVIHDGPRRAYSFDFYGVAKSQAGHHWILTVMDLCSREVLFIPCFTRTAEELVRNLLHHVVYVKGVPELFMSDEAKEFTGKTSCWALFFPGYSAHNH
jgi:transposase InsO family protein